MRRTLLAFVCGSVATAAIAVQPPLPRHPAPSPDGTRLAFSWQGDLWVVPATGGSASRLTANPGYDHHPTWLPDGAALAFMSDRDGADDVFVLDLGGTTPRRLTFHESSDSLQGVLGSDVVFTSRRHEAWDRMPAVYRVPLAGGTESMLTRILALDAVPSPDGRFLALVRGITPGERRHYRGSANRDLWQLELATGRLERLTETDWDEDGVAWAGNGALVYRTDAGVRDRNLYRLDLASRRTVPLTRHEGADVRAPRTSLDGRLAAYELWDAVWIVATDGGSAPRKLDIEVPGDLVDAAVERDTVRADAERVVPSPDGSQVALVVKGDVYVVQRRAKDLASVADAPTVRVTETVGRERDVVWSPDGQRLLYASDRTGRFDLLAASAVGRDDGKLFRADVFAEAPLTASPDLDERSPRPSPDGERLAWVRGKGSLVVARADGSEPRTLFEHWGDVSFAWSPDSKWIAFAREDQSHNTEVFVIPAAGGAAVNVSQHPQDDTDPVWSPDGRRLFWLSRRHAGTVDVWSVYLTRADHERSPEEWLQLFDDEKAAQDAAKAGDRTARKGEKADAAKPGPGGGSPRDEAGPPRPVAIDFGDIHERARPLTTLPGDEGEIALAPDARTVVFVTGLDGERDLYKVRWDGKELTRLTDGDVQPSQLAFAKDGKSVFYRTGKGTVGNVTLEGKAGDPTPFAARVTIDRPALRAQVFTEAWRELDAHFYDPAFHGADWGALRERYRPLALAASTRRDFDEVMNWMLGELNASHMGFRPPRGTAAPATGHLGIEVEPSADRRGVRITEILPGTPASRVDAALQVGERIVAVGGRELGAGDNFFAALAETVGQRVRLRLAGPTGERDVTLTPVKLADVRDARYQQWRKERRAIVDAASGGRLGYIHIQGMNAPSLEEFQRELFAAASGKQGLLIDVRNNGGGWTTDVLMAILNVRRHAWTVPRDGDPKIKAYPQDRLPLPAWTRPAATLCDEASYSNAEIFSWAFRTLERGPVVGMQTFGAVISTGAAVLTDGSTVRLPERGWHVAGSGVNMENHGCPPTHVVAQPPEQDLARDRDAQLERAIEVLLARLPADESLLPW
ncbi:MAG: PD40 domain-containing protein [Acidobacteria bacterium]|nr:PD40 domain-containing protein [Acidobacteriota bacterium]